MAERLADKLYRVALVLVVGYAVSLGFGPVMDNVDLGWQVAQGRWMVQHGALYTHDLLNYPTHGDPIINEYPLFELILYAAWSLGWLGPCLLAAAGYATVSVLLARAGWRLEGMQASALLFALGLTLICINVSSILRPHLVTYVCVVVLGLFLIRQRDAVSWREFWPMALLQIAWANCHSGFVIGPAMVGLFGAEIVIRRAIRERTFPAHTAMMWLGALLLLLLACLVNPYGLARFQPVLMQGGLESIRAYVGEMEPVAPVVAQLITWVTVIAALLLLMGTSRGLPWSFILLAVVFYHESLAAMKSWAIFGLFVPLIVLGAVRRQPVGAWLAAPCLIVNFFAASILAIELFAQPQVLGIKWREVDRGHSEMAVDAPAWMLAHGANGRLFHRCEDGGLLQLHGFDQGETFADTGFGKYSAETIHQVGLIGERPGLVPKYLAAYRPDFVVCGNFCYEWPWFLRTNGWRLVYYSTNSFVWTREGTRPDLPTVTPAEVEAGFDHDLHTNGGPRDARILGRNFIALASLGLDDLVLRKLAALPPDAHASSWYWEAARIMCFGDDAGSATLREAFEKEAESLPNRAATAEYRAYYACFVRHAPADARKILEADHDLTNNAAELLLRIELEQDDPAALALAQQSKIFNLRNGRHWQYLAQAEEKWGSLDAARTAWRKAVFYYPDDAELMQAARAFAEKHRDDVLAAAMADSEKIPSIK